MPDKSEAYLNGWLAHKSGFSNTDLKNPYHPGTQARSHAQWLAGWCARFSAMKHGHPLEYDDVQFED